MSEAPRRKSPRAPSVTLEDAVERAIKIYESERRHPAPTDVIAQSLGYKSANNGAALSMIASLRYYGLLEKAQAGKLAVSKDVESYQFAPNEDLKRELRAKWLTTPNVFREILEKCVGALPSDASLRYDMIQREFAPAAAESALNVLKKSVEFARYFENAGRAHLDSEQVPEAPTDTHEDVDAPAPASPPNPGHDRIPVRLSGGRRAWLEIPTPFYEADKKRLVAQIDLLLTEDEQ
jgi:hypothetical protein